MLDPIMPLAPLRLSTITVWPSDSLSLAATSRAIMAIVGPGGTGDTIVIGLAVGQACAKAGEPAAAMPTAREIAATARQTFFMGRSSDCDCSWRFSWRGLFRLDAGGADHLRP